SDDAMRWHDTARKLAFGGLVDRAALSSLRADPIRLAIVQASLLAAHEGGQTIKVLAAITGFAERTLARYLREGRLRRDNKRRDPWARTIQGPCGIDGCRNMDLGSGLVICLDCGRTSKALAAI